MKHIFAGKVALIVGAATEPGPTIARRLAGDGVTVALLDTNLGHIQAITIEITKNGGSASAWKLALDSAGNIHKNIDHIVEQYNRIDILINNTTRPLPQPLDSLTSTDFRNAIDAVLMAPFSCLCNVIQVMRERGYGRILNITSLDYLGLPGRVGAAAAQAAMFGLTRATALEIAPDNITINNLVLGDIGADSTLSDEEKTAVLNSIPVKRVGTLADVAHAAAFFSDEKAKYVTGQTFFVCGGKSAFFSMSI